jgi:hypothetical protein
MYPFQKINSSKEAVYLLFANLSRQEGLFRGGSKKSKKKQKWQKDLEISTITFCLFCFSLPFLLPFPKN